MMGRVSNGGFQVSCLTLSLVVVVVVSLCGQSQSSECVSDDEYRCGSFLTTACPNTYDYTVPNSYDFSDRSAWSGSVTAECPKLCGQCTVDGKVEAADRYKTRLSCPADLETVPSMCRQAPASSPWSNIGGAIDLGLAADQASCAKLCDEKSVIELRMSSACCEFDESTQACLLIPDGELYYVSTTSSKHAAKCDGIDGCYS